MDHFKKINSLPILPLYDEFNTLINSNKIKWNDIRQICINSIPGEENNIYYGAGSFIYNWHNQTTLDNGNIQVPQRKEKLKEEDFTEICTVFKGTLFEEIHIAISKKYKAGRMRIMELKPKECLSWHTDPSQRLHFPLHTHEGCLMVINSEAFHIPKNEWWLTDTTKLHTAFNGSKSPRLHLVAAILD